MLEDGSLCFRPIQGNGPIVEAATAVAVMRDIMNRYNLFYETTLALEQWVRASDDDKWLIEEKFPVLLAQAKQIG